MSMEIMLMIPQFVILPKALSTLALLGLVVAGVAEFRQGHIGRIGIVLNAFLLWQIFFDKWFFLPDWFAWYINFGSIVGILAVVTYFWRIRLPNIFYQIAFLLYGSISIVLIISLIFSFGILPV